jgi:hypothetical protein
MSVNFFECDRKTPFLIPPSIEDWLPQGHLARFVVEIVETARSSFFNGILCGSWVPGPQSVNVGGPFVLWIRGRHLFQP